MYCKYQKANPPTTSPFAIYQTCHLQIYTYYSLEINTNIILRQGIIPLLLKTTARLIDGTNAMWLEYLLRGILALTKDLGTPTPSQDSYNV
jgi:hypothetical protein